MPIKSDPSTWTDERHKRGLEGEELAKAYLERGGWQVIEHRFRMSRLEIDLVARRGSTVTFVEVKTRWSRKFGSPLEALTPTKKREIIRVAQAWVDRHGRPGDVYRFDVIGVTLCGAGRHRIEHIEDAFRNGWW